VDQRPRPSLGPMCEQSSSTAQEKDHHLPCGIASIDQRQCQQGPTHRAYKRMHRVPGAIEPGDLVSKKFSDRADSGDPDDPTIGERIERPELFRHGEPAHPHAEPDGENAEIQTPSGKEAHAGCNADDFYSAHSSHLGMRSAMMADALAIS